MQVVPPFGVRAEIPSSKLLECLTIEDVLNEGGMVLDPVTTEILRKKFKNNFDLCNFAIVIGRNTILSNPQATLKNVLDAVDSRAGEALEMETKEQTEE